MIDALHLTKSTGLRGIALTALALSLGACRGVPPANHTDNPPPPAAFRSSTPEVSPPDIDAQDLGAPSYSGPEYGLLDSGAAGFMAPDHRPQNTAAPATTSTNSTAPAYGAFRAPPVLPHIAEEWPTEVQPERQTAPARQISYEQVQVQEQVQEQEPAPISTPSPALPRDLDVAAEATAPHAEYAQTASFAHGDADFTPNVARVGHFAPSLPAGFPPTPYAGGLDGMHLCNDPFYPPEIWPLRKDEFLCDGGDKKLRVEVNHDWTVRGLDQEDTVVHYDTLAGGTNVEPSNCICIYAPRFASVRKTVGLLQTRLRQRSAGVDFGQGPVQQEELQIASTVLQPIQPGRNIGIDQTITFQDRNLAGEVGRLRILAGLESGFMPYENIQLIRIGQYDQSEKARLAESIDAAIAWTDIESVEVIVDADHAMVQETVVRPEQLEQSEPTGTPRMRICKVASRHDALPGEIVHFTLRFDNTGTQKVGNVTIIDNLTTRLEYVPGSAECSLDANFITTENEGESLVLRWEIIEPMEPGQGGIIRFQCRVR